MTDKELHKLSRAELLELLTSLSEENETLRGEMERMKKQLDDRAIQLQEAGSIAEAAINVSGVFKTAQDAADRYLENIRRMHDKAQKDAEDLTEQTRRTCAAMEEETQRNVESKWVSLKERLDRYVEAHQDLRDQLRALYAGCSAACEKENDEGNRN